MARGDGLLYNVWQAQVAAIIIIEHVKLMQYASGGSFHYTKQVLHVKNVAYNRKCCIMCFKIADTCHHRSQKI